MNHRAIDMDLVRHRAYELWTQRGCPAGSPEEDWLRAEQELLAAAPVTVEPTRSKSQPAVTRVEARPAAIPRPRRARSIVTRTPEAPAAQLLTTVAPSTPAARESGRRAAGGTRRRAT